MPVETPNRPPLLGLIGIGALTGLLAGLFGVGGGIVIVPLLVTAFRMDQRRAAATSLVAIVPTSLAGAITYGISGNIDLLAAAILVVGSLAGAPLGVRLLHRLPDRSLPWIFVGFAAIVAATMLLGSPHRGGEIELTWWTVAALVGTGLVAGILSGLVGVGGGVVAVPGLEFLAGAGDLLARGTSLAMIAPTSIMGIVSHRKHFQVDIRSGVAIGVTAVVVTPLGALLASLVDPKLGSILFAVFLAVVSVLVVLRSRKPKPRA